MIDNDLFGLFSTNYRSRHGTRSAPVPRAPWCVPWLADPVLWHRTRTVCSVPSRAFLHRSSSTRITGHLVDVGSTTFKSKSAGLCWLATTPTNQVLFGRFWRPVWIRMSSPCTRSTISWPMMSTSWNWRLIQMPAPSPRSTTSSDWLRKMVIYWK